MLKQEVSAPRSNRAAFFLVSLMLVALLPMMAPTVSAEGITLTVTPGSQEVNPGDSGEYTIRVYNDYSDPITVTIGSEEDPSNNECSNFNSVLLQTTLQIEGNSYEETTMNVTVTQTAEAEMECDTTVTAEVTAVFGAPGSPEPTLPEPSTVTVTTIASDGSGGAIWGVDLYFDNVKDRNEKNEVYDGGESELEYEITVENTGQQNSTTVNLTLQESDDCSGNANQFSASLNKNTVTLDAEDEDDEDANKEVVTLTIEVPNGQEADDYCWEVIGTVTTPNPTEEVTDSVNLNLEVPVLKECSLSLSKTSFSLDPGQEASFTATVSNDGNDDWSVSMAKDGPKSSWVSFDGPSDGVLPYDGGSGTKTFDLKIMPDDSVDADSSNVISIQAKDGNNQKCSDEITVILGQSFGAELSLSTNSLGPIEPGEFQTSTLTVTNTGNGPDTLRVTVSSAPSGWSVDLDQSTVSVDSRHSSGKSANVEFNVSVPLDALATESIELTFSVLPNGGGAAYQTKIVTVTVSETHGMDTDSIIPTDSQGYISQTGDYNDILVFPIEVENLGNNDDLFRFYVKQQRPSSGGNWDITFTDSAGDTKTEFNVPARQTSIINVNVLVPNVGNYNNNDIIIEINNLEDSNNADDDDDGLPDNKAQFSIRAIKNNITYSMDARFGEGEYDVVTIDNKAASAILAPEGTMTFDFWIENVGTPQIGPAGLLREDLAIIDVSGLEGIATRQILVNDELYDDSIPITTKYAIFNLTSQTYMFDENGEPYLAESEAGANSMMINYNISLYGNEVRKYKQKVTVIVEVSPSAETGASGLLEIVVFSQENAADRESGKITLSLEVQTIYDIQFNEGLETFYELEYPDRKEIAVEVINQGNTRTQFIIYTPESFRGWSVELDRNNVSCQDVTEGLKCWLDVDEVGEIVAIVRPSYDAEIKDNYTFTLAVEPVEIGVVGRENIEISVLGQPDDGPLGLGLSQGQIESGIYLIVAILFVGILYRAGKPSVDQFVQSGRNKNREKYAEKLIAAREQGFTPNSAFANNPVPYRSAKLEWFVLVPLTLGLYGVIVNYRIAKELKKYGDIGPGGVKHIIYSIIPLWNIVRMLQFVGEIKQLENKTMHSTKLSTKSPLIWLLLGMTVFPLIGIGLLFIGIIALIPIFLLTPALVGQGLAYAMYYVIFWGIAAYPFYRIWRMMQESLNASWALWFGKI